MWKRRLKWIQWISVGVVLGIIGISKAYAQAGMLVHAPYQLCFTPSGRCTHLIVKTILSAKQSVFVQAYSFTSKPIVKALILSKKRGVDVFVLLDKSNVGMPYAAISRLKKGGVPFLIDYIPEIAHNKVMIIDDQTVITGSFNFTKAAQYYYAENVLVIHSHALAQWYAQNFSKRRAVSKTLHAYCHPVTPLNAVACHQQSALLTGVQPSHPWHHLAHDLNHQSSHFWRHL